MYLEKLEKTLIKFKTFMHFKKLAKEGKTWQMITLLSKQMSILFGKND